MIEHLWMGEHRVRILHISDLHQRNDREEPGGWRMRAVLGDKWKQNLDTIVDDGRIDLVCFTGDLVQAGKPEEYAALTSFIDALVKRLGIDLAHLFVVPGNHDIDRDIAREPWSAIRNLGQHEAEHVSRWMAGESPPPRIEPSHADAILERQGAYRAWVQSVLKRKDLLPGPDKPHPRLGYRSTVRLLDRPFDVHVIGLDTAWLAGDHNDAGKLLLTDETIGRLASDLFGLRIALMHHPFGDLADGENCRAMLSTRVDLLLRGHVHRTGLSLWNEPNRDLRELAAGCLYQSNLYQNACTVIDITCDDTGRPLLPYRFWFRTWSPGGEFWGNNDLLYPGTDQGRLHWPSLPPLTSAQPRIDCEPAPLRLLQQSAATTTDPKAPEAVRSPWRDEKLTASERSFFRKCVFFGVVGNFAALRIDHWALWIPMLLMNLILITTITATAGVLQFTGLQVLRGRPSIIRHWAFLTAWGVIAVGAMITVFAIKLSRGAETDEIIWSMFQSMIAVVWAPFFVITMTGQPSGWHRYFRHRIFPFPGVVKVGDRSFVVEIITLHRPNPRDAPNEQMTWHLKFRNAEDDTSNDHISLTCSIAEDLLTTLKIGNNERSQMKFENLCAELYYECVLVELEQIFKKSEEKKRYPENFVQLLDKFTECSNTLFEQFMPIHKWLDDDDVAHQFTIDQRSHLHAVVQLFKMPVDHQKILKAFEQKGDTKELPAEFTQIFKRLEISTKLLEVLEQALSKIDGLPKEFVDFPKWLESYQGVAEELNELIESIETFNYRIVIREDNYGVKARRILERIGCRQEEFA